LQAIKRVVIYLGRSLPNASSGAQKRNWEKTNLSSSDLAPNRGLPSQGLSTLLVRSYRTFAPLPTRFWVLNFEFLSPNLALITLSAVYFCGTILAIARTGGYPASLGFWEPGLSSDLCSLQPPAPTLSPRTFLRLVQSATTCAYSLPCFIIHLIKCQNLRKGPQKPGFFENLSVRAKYFR